MYDIFYISDIPAGLKNLRKKFPFAKHARSLDEAKRKTFTSMFWAVWDDVVINAEFNFDYTVSPWDQEYIHVFKNDDKFDGICLIPKTASISDREFKYRFFLNKKDIDIVASTSLKTYDIFVVDTYEQYQHALENTTTEMFWMTSKHLTPVEDFKFDLYFTKQTNEFYHERRCNHAFKHIEDNREWYDGIFLCSIHTPLSKKEIDFRFPVDRKEWDIIASTPKLYDIFIVDTYEQYLHALENSTTEMFWATSKHVTPVDEFKFDLYFSKKNPDQLYDLTVNHAFKHIEDNREWYDGIFLCSKVAPLSKKEIEHRFLVDRKEWDVIASTPKLYDIFTVDTYDQYLYALENTTTELFWATSKNITPVDEFKFDLYFSKKNADHLYDLTVNHAFKHIEDNREWYDGIFLFNRNVQLSKKEIEHRFPVDRKEWDIVASKPKPYDIFTVDTYQEYLDALKNTSTEMFWMISKHITPTEDFKFDLHFSKKNSDQLYDLTVNHAFKHLEDDTETYDGIFLCSTHAVLSKKEIEHRFPVDRKEWDIIASTPKLYDVFTVDTYEDYLTAFRRTTTEMFWVVPAEIEVFNDFKFDLYFSKKTEKYAYERTINHVFKNLFKDEEVYTGSVMLMNSSKPVTEREIEFRFLLDKIEHREVISKTKQYDIVFISYNEPNADINYQRLLERFPHAKRVDKVKGIHQAHIEAAKLSSSHMFWVVDGDAIIDDNFNFDYLVTRYEKDIVHTWQSKNPINNLVYGYGGVKLLPKNLTLSMDTNTSDMTTAISKRFKSMPQISNITSFNTDPFNTWKSAFRECVKLASKTIQGQVDQETEERLNTWCTVVNGDFAIYALRGANAGRIYGQENAANPAALLKINDFEWLEEQFKLTSVLR